MKRRGTVGFLALTTLLASLSCAREPYSSEGYLETNGATLYYKTFGSGEPIVVLHGGPGFDHRQFLPFIEELASDYKVILYDQRGTGLSSGPVDSASITIDNFMDDIDAVRKAFGIEKMNLLGHSWGGILAMHYAIRNQEHLRSLILCSTAATVESFGVMRAAIEENRLPEDRATLEAMASSEEFRNKDPRAWEEFWRVYFKPYFPDQSLSATMDLTFTENTLQHSDAVARYILNSVGPFELHETLRSVRVPTLVLHGDSDPMPPAYGERIHASIPNSEFVLMRHSGHWIFVDATEQFTASIDDFLSRLADDSGSGALVHNRWRQP